MTGNNLWEILNLKRMLATEFEIKDLGSLRYFFGMDATRSKDGIVISQQKYILDLLKEIGNLRCGLVETQMDPNPGQDHSEEISLIGKGMYQTIDTCGKVNLLVTYQIRHHILQALLAST